MEKVPGCWEHISMVWAALKEAKSKNLSLATIWLDIANAYGSIPHKLIIFALHRYGVSPKWIHLIETYYSEIFSKSFSQEAPTSWHRHQRGIFAGCTLSIILFLAGMNIILEYSLVATTPQFHLNNISLPPMRAFIDDLNIMSSTICGAKTLLSRCTIALNWAGLTFRADKSRSIVIIKGRSVNTTPFSVSSPRELSDFTSFIPSIHSRPVKFLGRIIDGSISDRKSLDELEKKLLDGLNIIDTSHFTGSPKPWFLQHLLIPRIQWCFKSLGLRNRTINTTTKQLSKCSMECSFCIWLARKNKASSSKEIDLSLKTTEDPLVHQNPLSTTSKTNSLETNSPLPVGFINTGNTCYANAILQVLSVLQSLWIRVPSESSSLSPLLKSIALNMKIKSRSNKPVDPSNFLWALSRKISESRNVPFNFNSQQDAAEVLQFVIDELTMLPQSHFTGSLKL